MSPTEAEARKALEALFVEDEEFKELESEAGRFNLFQVANIGRRELVHSDCLAYFFDPAANHGFGTIVLDRFLWTIAENAPLDRLDFHLASTSDVEVLREWKLIDILIQFPTDRIVIAIENKVDSSEHSNQLQRYAESVAVSFKGWTILKLFLTIEGDSASCEDWDCLAYAKILRCLKDASKTLNRRNVNGNAVSFLNQYTDNLERFVMPKSKISELCLSLYAKHKQAIDLIIQNIPNARDQAREAFLALLRQRDDLKLLHETTGRVEFIPSEWERLPGIMEAIKSTRVLKFYAEFNPTDVKLYLYIGPAKRPEIRDKFYEVARSAKLTDNEQSEQWTRLWSKKMADFAADDIASQIKKSWDDFLLELPTIKGVFSSLLP
jgi:hypothetical protein